ncbi:MAG: hypothetical protein DRH56_00445 [Deltaproteobacteria bacterium]|nr:MAG: hypothetical protein DRH56_00445 [Deltaproteobacteria bacterium]
MASNFRISIHHNSGNFHIQLTGDFDGSSAHQLLNVLKSGCGGATRIFVHTSRLRSIHPFGRNVFQSHLSGIAGPERSLVFTGENAEKIAP